jgi:hypothetical protein
VHADSDNRDLYYYNATNREQRYPRDEINDNSTSSNGSHNATLCPTPRSPIVTFFASCGGTENKISIDGSPSLARQRARHNSMPVPPRGEGGLGALMISSICTNMFADSGEGALLRQSASAVVFFPITCDACSANPPLRPLNKDSISSPKTLTPRIESPCQCRRPFEGSPLNPFERPSPSAFEMGRHFAPKSILTDLPFRHLSTDLLRARDACWIQVSKDVRGHAMGIGTWIGRARRRSWVAWMVAELS